MKRTFAGILAGLLAGAALIGVTSGPAGAGDCSGNTATTPDGRIRLAGGDWIGGNTVDFTSVNVVLPVGQVQRYELQWKNRTNQPRTIKANLEALFREGYGVKFFAYGLNVSKNVRQGKAIVFKHVPAGKRTSLVTVQIRNKAATTTEAFVLFVTFFGGDPNRFINCEWLAAEAND